MFFLFFPPLFPYYIYPRPYWPVFSLPVKPDVLGRNDGPLEEGTSTGNPRWDVWRGGEAEDEMAGRKPARGLSLSRGRFGVADWETDVLRRCPIDDVETTFDLVSCIVVNGLSWRTSSTSVALFALLEKSPWQYSYCAIFNGERQSTKSSPTESEGIE
jgi:hypothetical protein